MYCASKILCIISKANRMIYKGRVVSPFINIKLCLLLRDFSYRLLDKAVVGFYIAES